MSPQIREASWRDVDELTRLDGELFEHEAWSEKQWWDELAARPRREYVVATLDDEIVGYAGVDHGGDAADVMTIATTPKVRGTGLGRELLSRLTAAATAGGASALLLEVRADNEPAIRLYEKAGFDRLNVRRRYYQPGDVDAIIMRLLLEKP